MILQALTDYYHRKAEAAGPGQAALAPEALTTKKFRLCWSWTMPGNW